MKIVIDFPIMLRLMTLAVAYRQEYSGFGFCEKEGDTIRVYDFVLLDVGSETFTEIPADKIVKLMDRPDAAKMKVWLHKHPMGRGTPGPENWSGTDNFTIANTPMGGLPELVKWSVSIVLTPCGWVGRIDNYVSHKTQHLAVEPQAPEAYDMLGEVMSSKNERMAKQREVRRQAEDPFVIFSPRSMTSLDGFDSIEETWLEQDDELDTAYEAMDECGVTMSDLVEMGRTPEQFLQAYQANRGDPDETLTEFLSGGIRQPYLSLDFHEAQLYLGSGE